MTKHARLAPSAASRWMNCSGSVALSEKAQSLLGPEVQSVYAASGSALHEAAELVLHDPETVVVGQTFNGVLVEEEHLSRFMPYVDYVNGIIDKYDADLYIEVKVIFHEDLVWGTADAVICFIDKKGFSHLVVVDLKTGSGVKVYAFENYQLLIYAIGAFEQFDFVYDFDYITMVISQPPLDHHSEWRIDNLELIEYQDKIMTAMARVAEFPHAYTAGEDQCRWCRGKALCPALEAEVTRARDMDLSVMTGDNMADALILVPLVKAWIDGVENFSKDYMMEGHAIEGYKVVGGRRSRGWGDVDRAQRYLKARIPKFQHNCFNMKFKSPSQIETMLRGVEPRREVDMESLAAWKEGNPTIALESDRRDSIGPGSRAAADFGELEE